MTRIHWGILCMGLGLLPRVAAAESEPSVDRLCDAAERRAEAFPEKATLFAKISLGDGRGRLRPTEWEAIASHSALEARVAEAERTSHSAFYEEAFVWDLPGNSSVVAMFTTSSSGDWSHMVAYCFRADGTLARSRSTLRTFLGGDGGVRRERTRRFDHAGRLLWKETRVFDLDTGRVRNDASFVDQDEPVFLTRVSLPFGRLL